MLHQTDEEESLPTRCVGWPEGDGSLLGNLLHLHVSHRCSTIKAANGFAFAVTVSGVWDWVAFGSFGSYRLQLRLRGYSYRDKPLKQHFDKVAA